MANSFFQFKQFTIHQDQCAMKVTTDGCLFGAWVAEFIQNKKNKNCLDIGTGTGLLSLMLAQKNNTLIIDSIEIDIAASEQASKNVASSPFYKQINVKVEDAKNLFFENKYDAIISNPPFYEKELKSNDDQKNKAHHDGGLLLSDLIPLIKNNLSANGVFFLLLPFKRKEDINNLLFTNDLSIVQMTLVRQTTQHDFFRMMIAGTHSTPNHSEAIVDEIAIKTDDGNYAIPFIDLLKEYYLYL